MNEYEKTARSLVEQMNDGETSTSLADEVTRDRMEALIVDALTDAAAAEREKWKAFAGPDGEPRKVNGTLIYTDDGDILGHGGQLWQLLNHSRDPGAIGLCQVKLVEWDEWDSDEDLKANAPRGSSTRESALAAQTKEPPHA